MTENQIIDYAYNLLEQDSEGWEVNGDEYLTARGYLGIGITHWENYENTTWEDLHATLTDAVQVSPVLVKTLTAGTYSYVCPANMKRPSSYVRTVSGGASLYWTVIKVTSLAAYADSIQNVCWFTGNLSIGFTLHFNPNTTLVTGAVINYEYYKKATLTTAETDVPEMQNPIFLAYWIATHMADGGIDPDMFTIAENMLEEMKTLNMASLSLVPDEIPDSLATSDGFGF